LKYIIGYVIILTMRSENKSSGQEQLSFIEAARRTQIIECAIETIATLGYAQASLAQIAKRAGISKGVIFYHFTNKEELIERIVTDIYIAGMCFMAPQIEAQSTMSSKLRAYIRTNVEFISSHRTQMVALVNIMTSVRTEQGTLRYDATAEEPILIALEDLLRKGQEEGEFRKFDTRVMAVMIRRAIDALPGLLAANRELDLEPYKREMITLFDLATRKSE
jgi:TetR/AcrR family transcriptional regulator, fatty acid metabolism regulator protein